MTLALMLGAAGCGLYVSGIGPESGEGGAGGATVSGSHSASSASSSSVGPGPSASSSSGLGPEDCFNNQDDNTDGKVDCADPMCGGGVAACETIGAEWSPIWMTQITDPAMIPMMPGKCADGSAQKLYFTQPAGAPTCSGCKCALGMGAACSAPQISCYFSNNGCTGNPDFVQSPPGGACVAINPPGGLITGSCKVTGMANVLNPACTIQDSVPTLAPMWGGAVLVCSTPSSPGGCMAGQLCVNEKPSTDGPLCIMSTTANACPAGWTKGTSAFSGGGDSRGCDACSCMLGCSGGSYVLHDHNDCTDNDPSMPVGGNCVGAPNLFDNAGAGLTPTAAGPAVGKCDGGGAHGQVDATGPVQICCK